MHLSLGLNGSSAIRRFECGDAIEIRGRIILDFYTGLPQIFQSFQHPLVPACLHTDLIPTVCTHVHYQTVVGSILP